jgi:hypothetical protein
MTRILVTERAKQDLRDILTDLRRGVAPRIGG